MAGLLPEWSMANFELRDKEFRLIRVAEGINVQMLGCITLLPAECVSLAHWLSKENKPFPWVMFFMKSLQFHGFVGYVASIKTSQPQSDIPALTQAARKRLQGFMQTCLAESARRSPKLALGDYRLARSHVLCP